MHENMTCMTKIFKTLFFGITDNDNGNSRCIVMDVQYLKTSDR